MNDIDNGVEIFEQILPNNCKLAIFRGGLMTNNPIEILNNAIYSYVKDDFHNDFVEITCDNPWVRVIIININDLPYKKYNNEEFTK